MTNPMNLTGHRILVTGASSRIGREAAILLSQLGGQVIPGGRDETRLRQTLEQLEGAGHQMAPLDLSQLDSIPGWIKGLAAAYGPFHGLVHSAGMHNAIPLRILTPAALDEMMRVNFHSGKAAIISLARSLAIELAPEKIRVNAVAPGFVQTEMADRLKQSPTPEQFSVIEGNHPLGLGNARDVANGITFLLADSSRWITGISLVIDGGYTAH
jgi:NAD(P)-dependent dehydrogenase (short-subunit alcohol dehydrogenase family)